MSMLSVLIGFGRIPSGSIRSGFLLHACRFPSGGTGFSTFSGYNQIRIHPNDHEKMAFGTEWGVFVAIVMMFGLKTAPTTFQRIIMEIFGEYIPAFMQVFLEDFVISSRREDHLDNLRMCLDKCRGSRLSLNLAKCVF